MKSILLMSIFLLKINKVIGLNLNKNDELIVKKFTQSTNELIDLLSTKEEENKNLKNNNLLLNDQLFIYQNKISSLQNELNSTKNLLQEKEDIINGMTEAAEFALENINLKL
jgi:hypothetical protein